MRGYSLTSGKTKSCGCLKLEAPHLPFLKESLPKYSPDVAAARKVWKPRYKEMSFEDFYEKSQLNCHYCGEKPSLIKTFKRKDKAIYYYNTLDRINSNKGHTIDNIVPCCLICNRAKLKRTIDEFKLYINNLTINKISFEEHRLNAKNISYDFILNNSIKSLITSIKDIYKITYNDGDLSLEQFYQLSQLNCYYCNSKPSNKRNCSLQRGSAQSKLTGLFIYNSLDRIDNNKCHDYNNVITCCKYCNSAKGALSLQNFNIWINKITNYNK